MEQGISSIEEERIMLLKLVEENVDTDTIERIEIVEKLIFPEPNEKLEIITSCDGSGECRGETISSTKS